MRIAVWHNLPSGGGKRALYCQAKGLVERGHHVEGWCPDSADRSFLPLSKLIKENVVPLRTARIPRWARHLNEIASVNARIEGMRDCCRVAARQMESGGFDVLFANSCREFYMSFIGQFVSFPKAIYLGEPFRRLYQAMPQFAWLAPKKLTSTGEAVRQLRARWRDFCQTYAWRTQAREEYEAAMSYETILVNSLFSRESVLRAYGLDSEVCYLGVDTDLFRPVAETKADYVVGMGSITFGKGIDRAIRGLAAMKSTSRPRFCWISNYSDSAYETEMMLQAKQLGVDLEIHKQASDQKVVELLSRAALFIYTPRLEPFGFAPLEANACGTPVLGIAEGGVRESIQHGKNGILVQSASPGELGQAIGRMLADGKGLQRMAAEAREHVCQHWSWKSALDRLEDLLQKRAVCGINSSVDWHASAYAAGEKACA